MTNTPGEFIWYELMTGDPDAAAGFYGAVVGWTVREFEPGAEYRLFSTPETEVAGLMRTPPEQASAPPSWFGYIGVDDVDAKARELVAAGAVQHVPPTDIPGVGRFAMLADPQGAPFYTAGFGWLKGDTMPMPDLGDYQFINIGERMIGAISPQPPDSPPPNWLYYFGVDDIDRAAQAVTANGGQIQYGPSEIPGGDYIIIVTDPQGATVGFVGPKRG